MYRPALGLGEEGSSVIEEGKSEEDSSRNMAEVRPVRQPWSRWVAHQESFSGVEEVDEAELEGGGEGEVGK